MQFAQLMTWRTGVPAELRSEWIKKRAEWKAPNGVNVLAEFVIPAGGNKVVIIFEADGFEAIVAMRAPWMRYFDIDVHPAVSMEALVEQAPKLLETLG